MKNSDIKIFDLVAYSKLMKTVYPWESSYFELFTFIRYSSVGTNERLMHIVRYVRLSFWIMVINYIGEQLQSSWRYH